MAPSTIVGQRLDLSRLESTWSRVVWKIPFDSTNDSSRLVEKVSRLENDSSRVEWFFRLDSTPMVNFLMVNGEYWMVIGGHGDSAPITPTAPIMVNWCDWCSWRNFNHWWNWWMVELANGAIRQLV
ncbi:unnamed protein product [Caenorhabditis angaria]|uniref:Uncharacterized protein n=1 Tax=Caenorhabditis angaria TaxID=860376 RepID=A0A9P1IYB8_9PELO|nr:unnamed protein product [Caenorhabditis angaria]